MQLELIKAVSYLAPLDFSRFTIRTVFNPLEMAFALSKDSPVLQNTNISCRDTRISSKFISCFE